MRWPSDERRGTSAPRPTMRVARIVDEWRVDGRWWETETHRDYYLLELDGGTLIELYREGDGWHLTAISD